MSSIEHVDQLLTLNGPEFVEAAYSALLGREADPTGRKHYLKALASGAGKAAVLRQLAESEEHRAHPVKLSGLEALIGEQRRARHWLWRPLLRGFRMERQAHRLEFQLGALADSVKKLQLETGDRFARLDGWMSHGGVVRGDPTRHGSPVDLAVDSRVVPWADTSALSQPARQIFARLTQACTAREES